MLNLLLGPRQLSANPVTFGLYFSEFFAGFGMLTAASFDLCFRTALAGKNFLQLDFIGRQRFSQCTRLRMETAIFKRFNLGIFFATIGLQCLILLGSARLALQMFQLLVDFFAQII